jgi:AcrR family transcriptional regulator
VRAHAGHGVQVEDVGEELLADVRLEAHQALGVDDHAAAEPAERAGITPSSVLYYYPRLDELMMEVSREAMERYAERRSRQVRELDDPVQQLRLAVRLGVPTGPDDEESRLLYELDAFVGSSPAFRVLSSAFFDRRVALYEHVLESGAARGPSSWPRRREPWRAASWPWRTGSASRW